MQSAQCTAKEKPFLCVVNNKLYFHYFIWKHGLQLGEERKNKKLNAKSERLKRHSLLCVIQEIYDLGSLSHEFSRKWLNFQFFRISDRSSNIILWPHLFKYIEIIILPGNFISLCLFFLLWLLVISQCDWLICHCC